MLAHELGLRVPHAVREREVIDGSLGYRVISRRVERHRDGGGEEEASGLRARNRHREAEEVPQTGEVRLKGPERQVEVDRPRDVDDYRDTLLDHLEGIPETKVGLREVRGQWSDLGLGARVEMKAFLGQGVEDALRWGWAADEAVDLSDGGSGGHAG